MSADDPRAEGHSTGDHAGRPAEAEVEQLRARLKALERENRRLRRLSPEALDEERHVAAALLGLSCASNHLRELIAETTLLVKDWSGCEAVGVRLREGDDYPYFETRGFPAEFVEAEASLCELDEAGRTVRDGEGNPVLECMCGNVLRGRCDPSLPFFTEFGSFWTNSTTDLLAATSEADRQARTRNRCHGEGYESVALVPLRVEEETFGLLQLNDPRRGMFTPQRIALLEDLACGLALALSQRRARDQARRRDSEMRALLDASPESMLLVDAEGNLLECNARVAHHLNASREKLIGRNIHALLPPEVAEVRRAKMLETIRTGRPMEFEDGHDGRILHHRITPVLSGDGRVRAVAIYASDVTEGRNAVEHLRQSRDYLDRMLNGMFEGVMVLDEDLVIRDVNDCFLDQYGFTREQALGRRCYELVGHTDHPCCHGEGACPARDVFAARRPVKCEHVHLAADGSERIAEINAFPMLRPDGSVEYAVELVHDVTERKRAEQALRDGEKKMRSIFRAAPIGIAVVTPDRVIAEVNDPFCEMTGYDREELVGRNARFLYPSVEEYEAIGRNRQTETAAKGSVAAETRFRRRDGKVIDVVLTSAPMQPGDRSSPVTTTALDITDRKRAEDALRRNRAELRAIYEHSPVMMCVLDAELRVRYANRAFTEFTGVPEEDLRAGRACGVFGCINAQDDPRGCGFGPKCPECNVRRALEDTLGTGCSHFRIEYEAILLLGGRRRHLTLLVSTALLPSADGDEVLLCLQDITDRKRAEEAVRASEARYRSLVESQDELVCRFAADGRVLFVNEAYCRFFGVSLGDVLTEGFMPLIHEADRDRAAEYMDRLLREGQTSEIEHRVLTSDGEVRWLHWRTRQIPSPSGTGVQYQGVARDVTERRRAERALRESEERFRALVEMSPMAILVVRDGRYVFGNPASARMLGFDPPVQMVGREVLATVAPEFRDPIRRRMERAEQGSDNPPTEIQLIRQDGRRVWTLSTSVAVTMDGRPTVLIAGLDITDRKQAREALRESEQRFRDLAELLPLALFEADLEGRLSFVNRAAAQTLAYDEDDPLGKLTSLDVIAPVDRPRARANIARVLSGENIGPNEYTCLRKDGREFTALIQSTAIRGGDGRAAGLRGFAMDISEQKRTEKELLAYQERLRSMAEAVSQAEDRERRRVAEGLHDEVSQNLGSLSLYLQVLSAAALTDPEREALGHSRDLLRRLSRAVRTLSFELCPPMLYETGLAAALSWLTEQFDRKHKASFAFEMPAPVDALPESQRAFAFRAARELLTNAAGHASPQKVFVRLHQKHGWIRLSVEDDGVGFEVSEAGQAEKFLHGFGLFSIRERARSLGGSLEIDSAPGVGSRICLSLCPNLREAYGDVSEH
jgi:PAS domain S-box-containing protein